MTATNTTQTQQHTAPLATHPTHTTSRSPHHPGLLLLLLYILPFHNSNPQTTPQHLELDANVEVEI